MNLSQLFATAQLARIDQADEIVAKHTDPEATDVVGAYGAIEFPLAVHMERLESVADRARKHRDRARALERMWRNEAEDVRLGLEPLVAWFEELHLAIGQALAGQDPVARKIARIAMYGEATPDAYRHGRGNLGAVLEGLALCDVSALGLPADFLDEGRRIEQGVARERREASRAYTRFQQETLRLRGALDEIQPLVVELEAARRRASHKAGFDLPGLELTLLKGAAGGGRRDDAVAPGSIFDDLPGDAPETGL